MGETFPVCIDLEGKLVVLVGGGGVAERRIDRLIGVGAEIRVIAPQATGQIERWADAECIDWSRRVYQTGDLEGTRLVFAATDDPDVQSEVVDEANRRGVPVDAVGRSAESDFSVPAVASVGRVRLAVETGGASPALSGALRRHLEEELDPGWGRGAELLAAIRPAAIREFDPSARRELFRALVSELPEALTGDAGRDERTRKWIVRAAERAGVADDIGSVLTAAGVESDSGTPQ